MADAVRPLLGMANGGGPVISERCRCTACSGAAGGVGVSLSVSTMAVYLRRIPNFSMLSRQDASNACNPATTSFELEGVQPVGAPCIVRLAASI